MIFITLGSQKFQFDRLLKVADELKIDEKIFAQIGYSNYKPVNFDYKKFLDREEFDAALNKSEIIITHGGSGAIMGAIKKGKKVIAVPRLVKYNEHVDNHQVQLIGEFKKLNLIYGCDDLDLEKAIYAVKNTTYKEYKSNTEKIIESIEEFISL